MESLAGYLGLPIVILVLTLSGYGTVLKTIEMLNVSRNLVLGISADGRDLTARQRTLILWSDWVFLWLGFLFFLLFFSAVMATVPNIFTAISAASDKPPPPWVKAMTSLHAAGFSIIQLACYPIAAFAGMTLVGMVIGGGLDFAAMWTHIREQAGADTVPDDTHGVVDDA